MASKALGYRPFFMSHRGDSGQKKIKTARGTAGMNADPSWSLHAIGPTSLTTALALRFSMFPDGLSKGLTHAKPKKIPNAVHNCQPMTRAPRILAGLISAAYIGTVAASTSATSLDKFTGTHPWHPFRYLGLDEQRPVLPRTW